MTFEEEEYEYRIAKERAIEQAYYAARRSRVEHLYSNACARCGDQREDWHNKLCGDEFCAKCSEYMDQFEPTDHFKEV